jgi:enoyl-CoA hydratase/carnithine racemase
MLPTPADETGEIVERAIGDGAREICIQRPARANALSTALVADLIEAVAAAYVDDTRLVVLRGAGKHFCSGFDRGASAAGHPSRAEMVGRGVQIESLLQLLWRAPFVTVACVQGKAVGAGADLAAVCDYRLASVDSSFSFPGFRLFGVSLGNRRLAESIGADRAFDTILRGSALDSEQARALGLVSQVLETHEQAKFVEQLQADIKDVQKQSIAILREATRAGSDGSADLDRIARSLAVGHRGSFRLSQEGQ